MFKTLEGDTLELAPWRMRRFMRLLADARSYPAGTPPHVLIQDLRQLLTRARRVSTEPRIGTTRLRSAGACCNACLLAQQRPGDAVLTLLGLTIEPAPTSAAAQQPTPMPPAAPVALAWRYWPTLATAAANARGPGVYVLVRGGRPAYAGRSASLQQRLTQRLRRAQHPGDRWLAAWTASVPANDLIAAEQMVVRALRERTGRRHVAYTR